MANLEVAVFDTIEAFAELPASITPIIKARRKAVAQAKIDKTEPLGFEGGLSFIANALVLGQSKDAPFSGVIWPGMSAPSLKDLQWFVDRLRMAIFAECALSLPDTGLATSATAVAPQLAFLSKLVARDSNLGRTHLFTLNYDTLFEQALNCLEYNISMDSRVARLRASIRPSMGSTSIIRARSLKVVSADSTSSCISTSCMARSTGSSTAMKCAPVIPT
ncbi:hypothetical protein [Granulibacter bethesdensis]|uniref:hypothetical protein n=1 Tax=Granulibacter bethesdensis TaxID=364410 RepID=UPI001C12AFF9|nr:hypothetical protein [Granulibacter bethesdensis]